MTFYQWLNEWWTGFVVMAGGALFIWLSLALLGEYRSAFMANPFSVMSLDVLLSILAAALLPPWPFSRCLQAHSSWQEGSCYWRRFCFPPSWIYGKQSDWPLGFSRVRFPR